MNPINEAILAQVILLLKEGRVEKAEALGFTPEELRIIATLDMVDLANISRSAVGFARFEIDHIIFKGFLMRLKSDCDTGKLVNRCLKSEPTYEFMRQNFGLSTTDTSHKRQALGLAPVKGRMKSLSEPEDVLLYECWMALKDTEEGADDIKLKVMLAEQTGIQLKVVDHKINHWTQ